MTSLLFQRHITQSRKHNNKREKQQKEVKTELGDVKKEEKEEENLHELFSSTKQNNSRYLNHRKLAIFPQNPNAVFGEVLHIPFCVFWLIKGVR